MTLSTGARLGPYEILAPIGAGGMGEVYRAKDPRLGRDVAIKVLPGSFSADKDRLRRFEQEARAAGILNHPNITAVYDIGTHEGAPYVVQELLEGETLRSSLAGGRLPPRKAIDYALQIAHGLAAAHEKRIVHRDLKPENLFVTKDGRVKILDFGLAKLTHTETGPEVTSLPTATAGTEPGVVMGTLGYMSPEQLRGEAVDARSDIFSFGAILYEMLSGRRAFRGATAADTISAILREEPAELSQSAPNVPPSLERVVRHCLEKSPAARFHSAPDVAFALEESASGSAAAPAAARPAAEVRRRGQRLALAGAAIAILVGILVGVRPLLERLRGGPGARAIQSIAVLPFENFSRDPEQEYFADGMTEELITGLAQIRSLRVISRTSAMQYKGTKKRIPEIGRELNVDAVLEGSVQRSGQRVRVTAQLIRASMDQHLWARSYERDLRDVLGLQSEVAAAVAHEVRVTLTPEEKVRLTQARPTDPEAHELYLKGRFHWNKGTEADLVEAIRDFESALARDPGYAPAYAGIADAYASLSDVYRPPYEVMPKARAAATKALQLDETLADTHVSLANIQFNYDRDWAAAEREARRALELNPNSAGAHDILGTYFAVLGRAAESAAEAARCLELDPLSVVFTSDAGWGRLAARDYDHAIEFFRKAVEIEPGFGFAHEGMAIAYVQKGRCPEAIAVAEKGTQADDSPFVLATSGGIYAACGKSDRAREVLKKLAGPYRNRYVCPYEIAVIHIGLGEKDEAFRSFEKGLQDRSICMPFLKVDPRLDPIRSDPRYVELVRRLAFPP